MSKQTSPKSEKKAWKSSCEQITMGIDLGDLWSHYCILDDDAELVEEGRFRTVARSIEKHFRGVPKARIAMEAGTHSIWISEQLQQWARGAGCEWLRVFSPIFP